MAAHLCPIEDRLHASPQPARRLREVHAIAWSEKLVGPDDDGVDDRDDLEALTDLVTLEAQTNHPDEARRLIDARLARAPKDPEVLTLAARTFATVGDLPSADVVIELADEVASGQRMGSTRPTWTRYR